jgi:membrane-associated phospholipid phosphatase
MDDEPERLFAWPGALNLAYGYLVLGPPTAFWFVFVYAGCDYLTGLHDYRVPLYFDFELAIPFVPATVLFYHSLHVAYSLAPFVLRTRGEMNAMALIWFLITLAAGVVFLVVPFEPGFAPPTEDELGPWRALYQLADDANLRYNSCPSLHVAWGIACIDVYATKAGRMGAMLLWLWGIGMVASTVLLHQHHLADVAGGLLLAFVGTRLIYPRLRGDIG